MKIQNPNTDIEANMNLNEHTKTKKREGDRLENVGLKVGPTNFCHFCYE